MATIFVSPTGDDADDGHSPANAKRTIQAALDALTAVGGTVRLLAGTFELTDKVTLLGPTRFYGDGIDETFVRGAADGGDQFIGEGITGIHFVGLTLDVAIYDTGVRNNINLGRVSDVTVSRVRFVCPSGWGLRIGCDNGDEEYSAYVNTNISVQDCEFVGTVPGHTTEQCVILNARDVRVTRCAFSEIAFKGIGLGLFQVVADALVTECTFSGVTPDVGTGAYYPVTGSSIRFDSCTFHCNNGIEGANGSDNAVESTSPGHTDSRLTDITRAVALSVTRCIFVTGGDGRGLRLGAVNGAWVFGCYFLCCDGVGLQIGLNGPGAVDDQRPRDCHGVRVEACSFAHNNRAHLDAVLHPDILVTFPPAGHDLQARISRCSFVNSSAAHHDLVVEPPDAVGLRPVSGLIFEDNVSAFVSLYTLVDPT